MNWTDNFSQQERKQIDQITRKVSQDLRKDSVKTIKEVKNHLRKELERKERKKAAKSVN